MKYPFDPSFNEVSENRYAALIEYLFLHYEEFASEVIGDDFEQSAYRNVLYRTAEFNYWEYRCDRAEEYKRCRRTGKAYIVTELISFEEFELSFVPPVVNAEFACLKLFLFIIEEFFIDGSIVHDQKRNCFKRDPNDEGLFEWIISEILTEQFPDIDSEKRNDLFFAPYTIGSDLSQLLPAYEFIFKLLKKKKLDFKYAPFPDSESEFDEIISKYLAEREINKILRSTLDDDDIERAVCNRKEAAKHAEIKKLLSLPVIVEAYFNVYGHLPAS